MDWIKEQCIQLSIIIIIIFLVADIICCYNEVSFQPYFYAWKQTTSTTMRAHPQYSYLKFYCYWFRLVRSFAIQIALHDNFYVTNSDDLLYGLCHFHFIYRGTVLLSVSIICESFAFYWKLLFVCRFYDWQQQIEFHASHAKSVWNQ